MPLSNEEITKLLTPKTRSGQERPDISLVDEMWIAWSAGFVDGEGCIAITRHSNSRKAHYVYLRLIVGQNVEAPLKRLELMYGGKVTFNTRRNYVWTCHGETAAAALRAMRPYMMVKGANADLAIEYQEKIANLPPEDRIEYFEKMKQLNSRTEDLY